MSWPAGESGWNMRSSLARAAWTTSWVIRTLEVFVKHARMTRCSCSLLPGQEAHDVAAVQLDKNLDTLRLDILLDTCSIEVFAQDGAAVLTSLAFPKEGSQGIQFAGEYTVKTLSFHTLK